MINFENDLSAIFNEWDAVTITDNPVVDPARTIKGMFVREYQDLAGEYSSFSGRLSALNVTETDAATLALDQTITAQSISFTIATKNYTGDGLVKLILMRS